LPIIEAEANRLGFLFPDYNIAGGGRRQIDQKFSHLSNQRKKVFRYWPVCL
jgi:hypothetical protein